MEFETNIWAVVQNLDGTMESPFYELEPATHMGNRLHAAPSSPINKELVSGEGAGFFSFVSCTTFTYTMPANPCL